MNTILLVILLAASVFGVLGAIAATKACGANKRDHMYKEAVELMGEAKKPGVITKSITDKLIGFYLRYSDGVTREECNFLYHAIVDIMMYKNRIKYLQETSYKSRVLQCDEIVEKKYRIR